jgi:hypothetical protein
MRIRDMLGLLTGRGNRRKHGKVEKLWQAIKQRSGGNGGKQSKLNAIAAGLKEGRRRKGGRIGTMHGVRHAEMHVIDGQHARQELKEYKFDNQSAPQE